MRLIDWVSGLVEKHGWKTALRICHRHEFGENKSGVHRSTVFYQQAIRWIKANAPAGELHEN